MRLSFRCTARSLRLAALTCALSACSDDEASSPPAEPPRLTISGFLANDGSRIQRHPPGSTVGIPCDGVLLVQVGPTDRSGRLQNWELRPPGNCGRINQCGYVVARLFDEGGDELSQGAAASVQVPVDLGTLPTGNYRVTAELRQGTTGEIFLVKPEDTTEDEEDAKDPRPVIAESTLTIGPSACPDGNGSGGAASGGTGSAGEGGLGGALGLGGATD